MRNPEEKEQYNNLVDILGFDPETGESKLKYQPPRTRYSKGILEEILGFNPENGQRVVKDFESLVRSPEFARIFNARTLSLFENGRNICRSIPSERFTAVDDDFKDVARRYHVVDETMPPEMQVFPTEHLAVFERLGSWGSDKPASDFRLLRVIQTSPTSRETQTIEFNDEKEVYISLSGGRWNRTHINYKDGALLLATSAGEEYFRKVTEKDVSQGFCHLSTPDGTLMIPGRLPVDPAGLFIDDFAILQNPFNARTTLDTWKDKVITDQLGISLNG